MFRTVALQQGSGFKLWPFWAKFACSLCAYLGFSVFLTQSKNMQIWSSGSSKFPIGVNVSLNICLSVLTLLWICDLLRAYPALLLIVASCELVYTLPFFIVIDC